MPQESHLFKATCLEVGDFVEDRVGVTAALTSASERHDTESAHIVATTCDRYESSYSIAIEADRRNISISFIFRENHIHRLATFFYFFKEVRQIFISIRTYHHIHDFFLFKKSVFYPFSHTTQYSHFHRWFLAFVHIELFQALANSLFRLFAHRTGVDEHQIGIINSISSIITYFREDRSHNLTVGEIHLASITLDV